MNLIECKHCTYRKNVTPSGICTIGTASDGLSLRCVGEWSKVKHYYLKRYINAFTTAMKSKWDGKLSYIDLFAGPGRCRIRETGDEINASPLLALNTKFPFGDYFFVDLDREVLKILSARCKTHQLFGRVHFMEGDCNRIIDKIIGSISLSSLSLAFIDPTGLDFNFTTAQRLSTRKIDLIITFPEGMAINRNIKHFLKQKHSLLDDWMGDKKWRELYGKKLRGKRDEIVERGIIGYYRERLESLGYHKVETGDEIVVRSTKKKVPLYSLIFACKDPFGYELWRNIIKIQSDGQRTLDL